MKKKKLLFIFFLIICANISAQETYSSMYRFDFSSKEDDSFHPQITQEKLPAQNNRSLFYRKLFNESLILIHKNGLSASINPLMNFSFGKSDLKKNNLFTNIRGIGVKGNIGKNIVFNTSFYETQRSTTQWIDDYYKTTGVIPGKTWPKAFKENAYDFGDVYGTVAFIKKIQDWKFLFQMGYDEFFMGEGYRSLFLSDHSLPYFHGHLELTYKNLTYHHITASLQNPNFRNFLNLEEPIRNLPFEKKTLNIHYINWKAFPDFSLGFFENTIFEIPQRSNHHFSWAYVNPIPFIQPLIYGLNQTQHVMIGLDANYHITKYWSIYSQIMIDDFKKDYTAFQFSSKYITPHVKARIEYNQVGENTYRFEDMRQSYTHYNGYLAHPLGSGFNEWILQMGYKINRLEIEGKANLITFTNNQTEKANRNFYHGVVAYVFNPQTRLQVFGSATYLQNKNTANELYFNIGIKTQLRNEYWDF